MVYESVGLVAESAVAVSDSAVAVSESWLVSHSAVLVYLLIQSFWLPRFPPTGFRVNKGLGFRACVV